MTPIYSPSRVDIGAAWTALELEIVAFHARSVIAFQVHELQQNPFLERDVSGFEDELPQRLTTSVSTIMQWVIVMHFLDTNEIGDTGDQLQ